MRIMIVDDNLAMRKVLAALFASAGHEVVGAYADGEGLEMRLHEDAPDLVCLDYNLPGRNGLELLKAIQQEKPSLDVVMMTASSQSDLAARAADAGASGFINKPFSQQQIIDELRAVDETRRAASSAAQRPTGSGGRGRRGTAVVADDNGSVRLLLKGLLEECGLSVAQSVANGSEALQAARNHKPRVMCLDIDMPVMGGLEALPLIVEASPETAVVMVTASADKTLVAQAAGLGAVGYILKPLRPAYVETFIRKLLGA